MMSSLFSLVSRKITPNVSWLEAVGDKVSLKFRLMTELCKYKTNFKLSPKPPIASNRCYQMPFWAVSFSIPNFPFLRIHYLLFRIR